MSTLEQLREAGGPVSRETFDDLVALTELLRRWNQRINLVASSTVPELWTRHILDSAQLYPLRADAERWVDLGSGGGFPGLVVATLMKGEGRGIIELVESNRKKTAFLLAATAQLHLPAKISPERIETRIARLPKPEIVTARALASLPELLALCAPWLAEGTRALFHKGREYQAEVAESRQHWDFDLVEHPSKVDDASVILEITNARPRQGMRNQG